MTRLGRQEYATVLRPRYRAATKREKGRLLDEFCRTAGCHRKAAIRLLRQAAPRRTRRRGRPRQYSADLVPLLTQLWELSDRACSKLLAPLLPTLVAALERHGELRMAPAVRAPLVALREKRGKGDRLVFLFVIIVLIPFSSPAQLCTRRKSSTSRPYVAR